MIKFFKSAIVLPLILIWASTTISFGQEIDSISTLHSKNKLNIFSPDELLNTPTTYVATKQEESVFDAPASITVYGKKDIERLGYYSLSDLAGITSGYSTLSLSGEKYFETRGQGAGFDNSKHLLLIDGIPVNHARAYKAFMEEEVPLLFAEKVEFLKGPASALYGPSAFYGVVNITSKSPDSIGTLAEGKLSFGTLNSNRRVMASALIKGEGGEGNISFGYYQKNASHSTFNQKPVTDSTMYWDDQKNLFLNSSYKITSGILKNISIGTIYINKSGGLGESWFPYSNEMNEINWQTFITYLKYEKALNRKLSLESYIKGNLSSESGQLANRTTLNNRKLHSSYYDEKQQDFEFLGQLRWAYSKNTNFVGGVNYDVRQGLGKKKSYSSFIFADSSEMLYIYPEPSPLVHTYSVFAQLQSTLNVLKGLLITAGFREDIRTIGQQQFSRFSPRVGIVQKLTNSVNIKAMYGHALRAPSIKEITLNEEAFNKLRDTIPNSSGVFKDVIAETIESYEAGITVNKKKLSGSILFFYNNSKNKIVGKSMLSENFYHNIPQAIGAKGLEVDIQYLIRSNLKIMANVATAHTRASDVDSVLTDYPTSKINLAVNYLLPAPFKLSSTIIVKRINDYYSPLKNTYLPGNTCIDANIIAAVTTNLSIEFMARNILNQRMYLPLNGEKMIPLPGRNYLVTLAYKF